ncbi:MAG: YqaA family protein [Bradymonadia bacterium]
MDAWSTGVEHAAWWGAWLAEGVWALAPICFIAATLLPFSSELAVVLALAGGASSGEVLLWASVGNCAGAGTDYLLGRWMGPAVVSRLKASAGGRRALRWSERWGPVALVGSWLPIVGDPLMVVAGIVRVPAWSWIGLGLGTRVARYAVLIWGFGGH